MKFDYVIGNPPYQEADGGAGVSARPVYNKFVEAAKTLDPEGIVLIMPSKWYSGGKGLNDFRKDMLTDRRVRRLVDYTDSADCFPGVDIAGGVCYFLWDKNYDGDCLYTNYYHGQKTTVMRNLGEFSTFIRYPIATQIIHKALSLGEKTLDYVVSSRKPFGLDTAVKPMSTGDIQLRYNGGTGKFRRDSITVGVELIDKWKVIISYLTAEHAGQPDKNGQFRVLSTMELLGPGCVCSETYLVAGSFGTKNEAENYMRFLKTRFVRFLIAQVAVTQHITKSAFCFVPDQDFSQSIDDNGLYSKYGLNNDEISFINKLIKEMT